MPSRTLKDYIGYQNGGMAQPSSTDVHNNIDNLILQAKLDEFDKTGIMRAQPEDPRSVADALTRDWIEGAVPMPAVGGLIKHIARKSPDIAKIVKETGLRNPISHYTTGSSAANILRSGAIKGTELSDGKRTVSLTRDPMFPSRGQGSIGTDTRFIFDRDELIKKGMPAKPIAVFNYRKTLDPWRGELPKYKSSMNPRFEFEERVVGDIPVENAKLIDILRLPLGHSGYSYSLLNLLGQLSRTNIPIIKSPETTRRLKSITESIEIDDIISRGNREFGMNTTIDDIYRLIDKPTYKFDPFKEVK